MHEYPVSILENSERRRVSDDFPSCLHGLVSITRGNVEDVRFKERLPEIQHILEVPDLMREGHPYF